MAQYVIPGHKTIDMNTGLLSHYQPKVSEKKQKQSRLVLGGTILKKDRFQIVKCISLIYNYGSGC